MNGRRSSRRSRGQVARIAAVADVHFGDDCSGTLRPHVERASDEVDALLIGGDLTRHGVVEEAEFLARELEGLPLPIAVVLGNHDYHCNEEKAIADVMKEAGATVLAGESTTIATGAGTLGIAGIKGFGGGFPGACGTEFGEPEMKAFVSHTRGHADALKGALEELDADHRVALLHYAPVEDTLRGERLELYPFLGSYLLAEAIDEAGADLVVHGHAHAGAEKGTTPGGVAVRNVAQPLIGRAFNIYCLGSDTDPAC